MAFTPSKWRSTALVICRYQLESPRFVVRIYCFYYVISSIVCEIRGKTVIKISSGRSGMISTLKVRQDAFSAHMHKRWAWRVRYLELTTHSSPPPLPLLQNRKLGGIKPLATAETLSRKARKHSFFALWVALARVTLHHLEKYVTPYACYLSVHKLRGIATMKSPK